MENEEIVLEEIEEESSVLKSVLVSAKNYEWINEEVLVAIVKVDHSDFTENLSSIKVCGKSSLEWVKLATSGPAQWVLDDLGEEELFREIKRISEGKKYVFVTYSDIPFLSKATFCEILDYFSSRNMNYLKLPRGFVIRVDMLGREGLKSGLFKTYSTNDFYVVNTPLGFTKFFNYMSEKIRAYHKNNGVIMFDEQSIFIEADVEIEEGVIIYPNNFLKGKTFVEKNVVLDCGNVIEDSVISSGARVVSSYILNSKISSDKKIGPFEKIINESK